MKHSLIILGSGPAGLTAALYAARSSLRPLVVSGPLPGGLLTQTSGVENYPGFQEPVNGFELTENMRVQAEKAGAVFLEGTAAKAELSRGGGLHKVILGDGTELICDALIIATGAAPRWLGLESEQRLRGHGVSACAICDGPFFRNASVCIAGGGDSACEEALYLSRFAKEVHLVHRRKEFRAAPVMLARVEAEPKIRIHTPYSVGEILGGDRVTGVRLIHAESGETQELACTGFFAALGHVPNTGLFRGQLEMDEQGYILLQCRSSATSVEGVFAAGDVSEPEYRQAVMAAGTGCRAAVDAFHYLAGRNAGT